MTPDKSQFRSLSDAVQRLLSYHVCQGSMPTEEDLKKGKQPVAPECPWDARHHPADAPQKGESHGAARVVATLVF